MMRRSGRKCILAVDDAAIILQRITDALGKDYQVVTVNSGSRALRYLEKEKPDLILLDIRMAPKDGFQTLREIRAMEDRADIPVVMLTGLEDKRYVMEGIKLGICDYILKPLPPMTCWIGSTGFWPPTRPGPRRRRRWRSFDR